MMIGQKISHYTLEDKIGEGGFGDVFRARDDNTGMEVAIKCSRPDRGKQLEDFQQRFMREVSCVSRLSHPGIVQLFDYGSLPDGTLYLVMEYVCGINLDVLIKRDAPYSYEYASNVILQILHALQDAHMQGIVHRDLKPANIMIVRQGLCQDVVKLLDFGIAKAYDGSEPDLTRQTFQNSAGFGTPQYMPPECFYGKKIGPFTDIYAVGLLFYELLTGKQAMAGNNIWEVVQKQLRYFPELPEPFCTGPLNDVFRMALAKDPEMRYASAAEMIRDINAIAHSPALAVYREANQGPNDAVPVTYAAQPPANVGGNGESDFDRNDEDSTIDNMVFTEQQNMLANNGNDANLNTMIFDSDVSFAALRSPTGSLYDELDSLADSAPTDDMSRIVPSVTMPHPCYEDAPDDYRGQDCSTQDLHAGILNSATNVFECPSDEMDIATCAMEAHPEFADLPPGNLVRVNTDNSVPDDELGERATRMYDADRMPQIPEGEEDLSPVFHQQRTKFLASRQIKAGIPTVLGRQSFFGRLLYRFEMSPVGIKILTSRPVAAISRWTHRMSKFTDMLYERHFLAMVIVICVLLVILMVVLGWLLLT